MLEDVTLRFGLFCYSKDFSSSWGLVIHVMK